MERSDMENSLSRMRPHLVSEWSEKNFPLTPDTVTFGSNKTVWWKGACGHEWQKNRIRVCSIFFEDFIITISHHTAECFVEVSLILNIPVTVDKNKVVIAVHSTLTADFSLRLKLSLH